MPKFKFTYWNEDGDEVNAEVPGKYEVCGRCMGTGVTEPDGFSDGFTRDDFADDPDFAEDYFQGRYDVQCSECKGLRVVIGPDCFKEEDKKKLEAYYENAQNEAEFHRECEMERRMGA